MAFPIEVLTEMVKTNKAMKVYLADMGIFLDSGVNVSALPAGLYEAQLFTMSGEEISTWPDTVLAVAEIPAGTFSIHVATPLSQGSTETNTNSTGSSGGGCAAGASALLIALSSLAILRKR